MQCKSIKEKDKNKIKTIEDIHAYIIIHFKFKSLFEAAWVGLLRSNCISPLVLILCVLNTQEVFPRLPSNIGNYSAVSK